MAKSVLDIVIKLSKQGGADKETIKGLVSVKTAIKEAAVVGASLVVVGYAIQKGWQQTGEVAVAYANQVRGITQSTGLQAEEASKLIQVLDDMKISYEDLQKIVQKNGDEFDYSIQGLARMSDAYLSLTDEQEKADFMQDRFGKNWAQFVEVMKKGSAALMAAGDGVNKALILDDEALDNAREYEKNLDDINDSVLALKVSIGNALLPPVNSFLVAMTTQNEVIKEGVIQTGRFGTIVGNAARAQEIQNNIVSSGTQSYIAWAAAMTDATASQSTVNEALEVAEINYMDIIGLTQKMSDAQMDYADKVAETNADITLTEEERKTKLGELATEYEAATARIVSANFLQTLSVEGVTQAEFAMYTEFQVATGQMTEAAAAQALALNQITTAAAEGQLSVSEMRAAIELLQSKEVTLTVNEIYNIVRRESAMQAYRVGEKNYASGTSGWERVPAGYPNDSYSIGLSSGEEYAVIPPGGGGQSGSGGAGGGGGGAVSVTININSMVNTADREKVKTELLPVILDGIRSAQAQGLVR